MKYIRKYLAMLIVCIIIGMALAIWAVLIEPARIHYNTHRLEVKNWPESLAGFTVAFITDAHVGSPHITLAKMQEIVEKTNALKPDMILLGGDYVVQGVLGGGHVPSRDIVAVLAKLQAPHGVFGVLGNHDWRDGASRIEQEFEQQHIPMLEDRATYITVGDAGFWLVGVSDYNEGAHDVVKALSGVTSDAPLIVLTHSPDIFPQIPERAGLTLAGHTHGGQVYIPLLGRLVVPSKYGQRYALGLVQESGKSLFVGAGIGTSILPIRFMTPPEVSILKLYPAAAQ
jgi:predicted MPP superfamily phosphohydrolase